jgi:hypothetical protein
VTLFRNTLLNLSITIEREAQAGMSNSTFSDTVGCDDFGYDGIFEAFEVSGKVREFGAYTRPHC